MRQLDNTQPEAVDSVDSQNMYLGFEEKIFFFSNQKKLSGSNLSTARLYTTEDATEGGQGSKCIENSCQHCQNWVHLVLVVHYFYDGAQWHLVVALVVARPGKAARS